MHASPPKLPGVTPGRCQVSAKILGGEALPWVARPSAPVCGWRYRLDGCRFSTMRLRAGLAGGVALVLYAWGCASPPLWELPPGLQSGSRVRVVAPRLGRAWQAGRVQLSSEGCWTIEAAVTHDPNAITILNPGELTRLQLSKAVRPPDWWAVPEEAEGWTEVALEVLHNAVAPKCKHRLGTSVLRQAAPRSALRRASGRVAFLTGGKLHVPWRIHRVGQTTEPGPLGRSDTRLHHDAAEWTRGERTPTILPPGDCLRRGTHTMQLRLPQRSGRSASGDSLS